MICIIIACLASENGVKIGLKGEPLVLGCDKLRQECLTWRDLAVRNSKCGKIKNRCRVDGNFTKDYMCRCPLTLCK